jgi:hypothetical protein
MAQTTRETDASNGAVLDVLQRLWQTKLNGIKLIEDWIAETRDAEVVAGLTNQLIDERRHLRLVGDQIRRFGGRFHAIQSDGIARAFAEAKANRADVQRLFAFHRGIKAFTLDRCSHLMPYVDAALAQTLERIAQEEERHIRWADLRLQRLLTHDKMRDCNLLLGRMQSTLESVWGRSWRQAGVWAGFDRNRRGA